ncbi:hypothetical protein RyT2_13610 [Pseudolactococcus yaeyamensis]
MAVNDKQTILVSDEVAEAHNSGESNVPPKGMRSEISTVQDTPLSATPSTLVNASEDTVLPPDTNEEIQSQHLAMPKDEPDVISEISDSTDDDMSESQQAVVSNKTDALKTSAPIANEVIEETSEVITQQQASWQKIQELYAIGAVDMSFEILEKYLAYDLTAEERMTAIRFKVAHLRETGQIEQLLSFLEQEKSQVQGENSIQIKLLLNLFLKYKK